VPPQEIRWLVLVTHSGTALIRADGAPGFAGVVVGVDVGVAVGVVVGGVVLVEPVVVKVWSAP